VPGSLLRPGYLPVCPFLADEVCLIGRVTIVGSTAGTGVEEATGLKPRDASCGLV
jgi:hypothetical protein